MRAWPGGCASPDILIIRSVGDLVLETGRLIHENRDDINALSTLVIAAFTVALWWATVAMKRVAAQQHAEMVASTAVAKTAAEAAQASADAARAALDRPWLAIERIRHNEAKWADGADYLTAQFRIANYGKAPAFIVSLKAALFHSPGPFNEMDFPVRPLPSYIWHFPDRAELSEFIFNNGRPPVVDIKDSPDDFPAIPHDESPDRRYFASNLDVEIAVPGGDRTVTFFFRGTKKFETFVKAISIQQTCQIFLIGWMIYTVPGQESEVLSFCYQGNRHGSFDLLFGPPYNERKKAI